MSLRPPKLVKGDVVEFVADRPRYEPLNGHIGVITKTRYYTYIVHWITDYYVSLGNILMSMTIDEASRASADWRLDTMLRKIGHIDIEDIEE
jgi:hypothetical protein